jgi:hypothetical protein
VLADLAEGHLPSAVHAVHFERRASEAFAEILAGAVDEVLVWGSRESGKTQVAAGALLALAELHGRAGYPLPLRALWLHSSLVDASAKTARSLEEPMWSACWQIREDRRVVAAVLGGREYVVADFVACQDVASKERLRASCHTIIAEEVIGTMDEAGGIGEREYAVALTSMMRLETRRHVSAITTNPGSRESWPYQRFLAAGHDPRRVAMHVPMRDRLSAAEIEKRAAPFRQESADLRARLIEETWTDLKLGPEVCVGYSPSKHVAEAPLWVVPMTPLYLGWDTSPASHVHACAILQRNGPRIHCFATFAATTGFKQFVEGPVLGWFLKHASWALGKENAREFLVHCLDPSAFTWEGGDVDQNAMDRIRASLGGGSFRQGAVHWSARIGPLLAVLSDTSDVAFKFDPGANTDLGRRGFLNMWHYDLTRGGTVERDAPAKNERLFADAGDAICYALGEMHPSEGLWRRKPKGSKPTPSKRDYSPLDYTSWGRPRA